MSWGLRGAPQIYASFVTIISHKTLVQSTIFVLLCMGVRLKSRRCPTQVCRGGGMADATDLKSVEG